MNQEKKPCLRVQIYQLIKEKRGNKVHSGEIEMFGQSLNYKASNADRRARDLVEEFRTVKGVRQPSPYYCPEIKSAIENKSTVYWYDEPQRVSTASNYRCAYCSKDAVTYLQDRPVCQLHSKKQVAPVGLF